MPGSTLSITGKFLLFTMFLAHTQLSGQDRITGSNWVTRSEVMAPKAMAATSQPLATQVALQTMRAGGNAIDAAIAANACMGLMEPTGCGVGGDLFAIVWWEPDQKLYGLNASGPSPASLTLDYFIENKYKKIPGHGPLPVSVPGCVDGWRMLHEKFGKLSVQQTLQPAIDYANAGFPLTEVIAYYWERNAALLKQYEGFAEVFMPNGKSPQTGEMFRNPDLAKTYQRMADSGFRIFYDGQIAHIIEDYLHQQGGFLSASDLQTYHAEWVEPISINYRGYEVWELPPNGQGLAALQILSMLQGFDIKNMGFGSSAYIHLFTETKKLAFEDRAKYFADPDFSGLDPMILLSNEYIKERTSLIKTNHSSDSYPAGELEAGNTIYLTVADEYGNMVSLIQSNYRGMGSGMTPPGLGFVLQDRGELFSLDPGHANVYEPGKRPFHTIIPAFITLDGKPYVSFGLMGGAMQPQGHAQIVVNLIDFGMSLQEAGDAPRIRHGGSSQPTGEQMTDGGTLFLESGFSPETLKELKRKGHKIEFSLGGFGGYQAIMKNTNGVYVGASESRKDGQAAGY